AGRRRRHRARRARAARRHARRRRARPHHGPDHHQRRGRHTAAHRVGGQALHRGRRADAPGGGPGDGDPERRAAHPPRAEPQRRRGDERAVLAVRGPGGHRAGRGTARADGDEPHGPARAVGRDADLGAGRGHALRVRPHAARARGPRPRAELARGGAGDGRRRVRRGLRPARPGPARHRGGEAGLAVLPAVERRPPLRRPAGCRGPLRRRAPVEPAAGLRRRPHGARRRRGRGPGRAGRL
ncbi:MAG: hypothetical protein AVDCRST_MAG54-4357, partial [uncultured Actinomycetospora sp.]